MTLHEGAKVLHAGTPLKEARGAMILLHGRGGTAEDILGLSRPLGLEGIAYLAPQASGYTWYPQSFLAPRAANEPWLSSALGLVETLVKQSGLPAEQVLVAGFSQGACLASEFVASYPRRYAGLLALTGGLVGPQGSDLGHKGELAGTPALLLSGDPDPHVPWARVAETAAQLNRMGAQAQAVRYPGRPHTVSQEELAVARAFVVKAFGGDGRQR